MIHVTAAATILVLVAQTASAADDTTPAAKRYEALLDEYEQDGGPRIFAKRFLGFAKEHPHEPTADDALLWIVQNVRGRPDTSTALNLLAKHHLSSEKLGPACVHISRSRSAAAEKLLRGMLEQSPHKETRAQACFHLARLLNVESGIVDQLKQQPDLAERVLQYYGKEYGKYLSSLNPAELTKRREQVYELMLDTFPDVEVEGGTMGKTAEQALFAIRHLSIGRRAPEIKGQDILGSEFKLSDYRGKVVMLTFWGHW